jgi:SAM-dependent methyltransferase
MSSPLRDPSLTVLERDVQLSQSVLWRMQREYYAARGVRVWTEDAVPQYITNNPFIAEIYARIVLDFMKDCGAKPLRILELGAGTGKFAFLFLRRLRDLLRASGIAPSAVRYCLTDCSEPLLQTWRANEHLAGLVADGILEFELLQVGEESKLRFIAESPPGPLVVIANYVLDSLAQDAFVVKDGELFDALVTTRSPAPEASLAQLQISFQDLKAGARRYPDPVWNNILESYRATLAAATLTFPTQALRTLADLAARSDGNFLALVADKGFAYEEDLALAQGPPALEFHASGCFSLMVNLDAIARHFEATGGKALLPDKYSALSVCAFLRGAPGLQFSNTEDAYRDAQRAIGPDDVFTLFAWLNAHMEEMSVAQILAALRLTRWDPIAMLRLFPVLAPQVQSVVAERRDLRNAVLRTWENHYPVGPGENALAFQCGVILLGLRFYEEAETMFRVSQRVLGTSAATSYNLGLCATGLGRPGDALTLMADACSLDPAFEPAQAARRRLEEGARQG